MGVVSGNVSMITNNISYAPQLNSPNLNFGNKSLFALKSFAGWDFENNRYNPLSGATGGAIFGGVTGLASGITNYTNIGQAKFWTEKPIGKVLNFAYNPRYGYDMASGKLTIGTGKLITQRALTYVTWAGTAVGLRAGGTALYNAVVSPDKRVEFTVKDAMETVTWATYARFLASPNKVAQFLTRTGKDGKPMEMSAGKNLVRLAAVFGSGAGLNIGKDFAIGGLEQRLNQPLGASYKRDENGKAILVDGKKQFLVDERGRVYNGLVWGNSTPGQITVSGIKGGFYGTLFSFAVSPKGQNYLKGVFGHLKNYG